MFQKKPVVVEAMQWDGSTDCILAIQEFMGVDELRVRVAPRGREQEGDRIVIHTLEGDMEASVGDWIIKGVADEVYPCKPHIFAATYLAVGVAPDRFDFAEAVRLIKRGLKVARQGWNGKGMWIALSPGCERLDAAKVWSPAARSFVAGRGGNVTFRPNIIMKTADDEIVPWVASQTDMLAEDWVLAD